MKIPNRITLDEMITQKAQELDWLRAYRDIVRCGDCNIFRNKECIWKPNPGQMVRYNCPHYEGIIGGGK